MGLAWGLSAPASKLLPEYLPIVFAFAFFSFSFSFLFSFFSFFFFFPSFSFGFVAAVVVFVSFVKVFMFVLFVDALPSLRFSLGVAILDRLLIRARERIERMARSAMEPPSGFPPFCTGGTARKPRSGTENKVVEELNVPTLGREGASFSRIPESRELNRARESGNGSDRRGSGAVNR